MHQTIKRRQVGWMHDNLQAFKCPYSKCTNLPGLLPQISIAKEDKCMRKGQDEWERFTLSGKVEDYLRYSAVKPADFETEGMGTQSHAGFAYSDRDHTEGGTHRGI